MEGVRATERGPDWRLPQAPWVCFHCPRIPSEVAEALSAAGLGKEGPRMEQGSEGREAG